MKNVSEEVVEEDAPTEEVVEDVVEEVNPVKKDKLTSFIETLTSDEVNRFTSSYLKHIRITKDYI